VVLVTGAGNGLGRDYALAFAARGAKVVVNDLGGDIKGGGQSSRPADLVVEEIRANGGTAVANYDSVENGENLVKTALDNFGRIDVIVNNAGILRDKSFARITDADWDIIHKIHLRSVFLTVRAAWPHMKQQKYGRIITVSSAAGIYGNFGQANYSAAKLGVVGLMNTLAVEGAKDNILCHSIAPIAGSRLTQTVMPESMLEALKPEYVSPVVLWLCHEDCKDTGGLYECGAGYVTKLRWQRSEGAVVRTAGVKMTPEVVRDNWSKITDFSGNVQYPGSMNEANAHYIVALQAVDGGDKMDRGDRRKHIKTNATSATAASAIGASFKDKKFPYNERDVIIYALGVGVSTKQSDYLKFLFESNADFSVLPTYAVIPCMQAVGDAIINGDFKGFKVNPAMILHGEQYLEVLKPLKPNDVLISKASVVDVLDKGSGAIIAVNVDAFDPSGAKIIFAQTVIFIQKAGGFGGKKTSDKLVALGEPPRRAPDAVIRETTTIDQAALYRMSGDKNPLHIDPDFASLGGFSQPILHGLCSFGFAARHVLKQYCNNDVRKFKAIKVRFTNVVLPGQMLETSMWKESSRVYLQCKIVETGKLCLSGAYVDLYEDKLGQVSGSVTLKSDTLFQLAEEKVKARPDLVQTINALYVYNITKNGSTVAQYTLDLSTSTGGSVYKGSPSRAADCTITVSDEDLSDLISGKLNDKIAFASGRVTIDGNPMLVMRLEMLFRELSKL